MQKNELSLNEKTRRALISEDESRKKARTALRAAMPVSSDKVFELTLDDIDKAELGLVSVEKEKAAKKKESELVEDGEEETEDSTVDVIRGETLNILTDLVNLSKAPRTASTVK